MTSIMRRIERVNTNAMTVVLPHAAANIYTSLHRMWAKVPPYSHPQMQSGD